MFFFSFLSLDIRSIVRLHTEYSGWVVGLILIGWLLFVRILRVGYGKGTVFGGLWGIAVGLLFLLIILFFFALNVYRVWV